LEAQLPAHGGQRRVMRVFFPDLAGFTSTCESMTPGTAVHFPNQCFSFMSEVIGRRDGIIDKYIGDSLTAFWDPPFVEAPHHA
jgi:adenylate cyclase